MYHFFVKPEQVETDRIIITGTDVNHMKNVLRMKAGQEILISDGTGRDYRCEICCLDTDQVETKVISCQEMNRELPARIYLFQGLPKGDKMELIIQKAVELGVYQIIPVSTKRSVVKLDHKKEEAKIKRWNAISESAAKQSKRMMIPTVTPVMNFSQALELAGQMDVRLMPYEEAQNMRETRDGIRLAKTGSTVAVFIGPEGGFDGEEVRLASQFGLLPITLGKRILRTETAGLAILSVLMFELEALEGEIHGNLF